MDAPTLAIFDENTYLDDSQINTFAAFAELTYSPIQKLKFVGGLRVEQTQNYLISRQSTFVDSASTLTMTQNFSNYTTIDIDEPQFIPRLSAIYSINTNNVIKAIYSQSKKRASYVENDNAFRSGGDNLTFADMSTIELNYLTVLSKKINANLSVYNNNLNNLVIRSVIVNSEDNSTSVKVNNAGEMNTIGAELTLQVQPIKNLRTDLSFSYQLTTDHSEGMDTLTVAFAPPFLGYLKMTYDITDKISIGLKGLFVDSMEDEYNFQAKKRYSTTAPSYFTLDANLHAQIWKGLFINVLASNLTNAEIRYVATQNTAWMDKGLLGYNRRFKVTLGYNF